MLTEKSLEAVLWLGKRGFHAHYIEEKTGVSKSSVYRVTKENGFSLRDYRNGETQEAVVVVRACPYIVVRHHKLKRA